MANANHYDTLCVEPTATPEEIKVSWRRLMKNFHPDTAGDAGIVMTQRLNAAYTVVGNPTSRRAYDRDLLADAEPTPEPTYVPTPEPTYQAPTQTRPTGPTAPAAPTAPTGSPAVWDAERYAFVRKVSLISWGIIFVGLVVAAIALNSTMSSFWLAPIGFAAVLTAARRELKLWRTAILGLAILAGPLGAIGVFGFSSWATNAGPIPMISQALIAAAAFGAHNVAAPLRSLRTVKPRA